MAGNNDENEALCGNQARIRGNLCGESTASTSRDIPLLLGGDRNDNKYPAKGTVREEEVIESGGER
eukprot:scaffold4554_cov178-Amphora_coffeaeformis.AAC.2